MVDLPPRPIRPGPTPKRTASEHEARVKKRPKLLPLDQQSSTASTERALELFGILARDDESDGEDEASEASAEDFSSADKSRVRHRKSYTREQKLAAVAFATRTDFKYADGSIGPLSRYTAGRKLGITSGMICMWIKNRDKIANGKKGTRKQILAQQAQQPKMEERLNELFREKRVIGRQIDGKWFFRNARVIYGNLYPERVIMLATGRKLYEGFKFSNGWFSGFKKRHNITSRAITKKAQKPPEELRETILKWLRFNRRNSQPLPDQVTAEIGRYQLSEITNMDQSPIAYEFISDKTYDLKGEKTVWTKSARSGWDKRQATLQIMVHADGICRSKPLLIFRGKYDNNSTARRAESKRYHSGVIVEFNDDAWANEATILRWIKKQYLPATAYPSKTVPRLLTMDSFTAQKTDKVLQKLREINTIPSLIPGGCTGYVQVLDVAVNKPFKDLVKEYSEIHYDLHSKEWEAGKYSTADRRVLLTQWVGKAWKKYHEDNQEVIKQTFRDVGLTLAIDGSEDKQLKIRDLPDLVVGDWQRLDEKNDDSEAEDGEADEDIGEEDESSHVDADVIYDYIKVATSVD